MSFLLPLRDSRVLRMFLYNLVVWIGGNGLLALVPIRAMDLGMPMEKTGLLMAVLYCGMVVGSLLTGWILKFIPRHLTLSLIGAVHCAAYISMGVAHDLWSFSAASLVVWLCFGLEICTLKITASIYTGASDRGAVLGIILLTSPLGAVLGGLAMGRVLDFAGFTAMIFGAAALVLLLPVLAFGLRSANWKLSGIAVKDSRREPLPAIAYQLAFLNLVISFVGFCGRAGLPLVMKEQHLSAGTIVATVAAGGAVGIPLCLRLGRLSDQIGRPLVLAGCILATGIGVALLSIQTTPLTSFMSAGLVSVLFYGAMPARTAVVADVVGEASLAKAMSLVESFSWIGGIGGFFLTSFGLTHIGKTYFLWPASIGILASIAALWLPNFLSSKEP